MKLNLFLAFGLVVSIALAALHDDQKLTAIEEQQRAAAVLEAQREEAFRTRLATRDTVDNVSSANDALVDGMNSNADAAK